MTRGQRNWLLAGSLLSGVTGLIYGILKYFFKVQTEWGMSSHPFQSWGLYSHIILSPILIFAVGIVWQEHVWKKIKSKHQSMRRSGLALSYTFFIMCWSGYLLQVSVGKEFKNIMLILHLVSSGVWSLAFFYHYVIGSRRSTIKEELRIRLPWPRGRSL